MQLGSSLNALKILPDFERMTDDEFEQWWLTEVSAEVLKQLPEDNPEDDLAVIYSVCKKYGNTANLFER